MDHKKYTHHITYWVIIFILMMIIGFLTLRKPEIPYALSAEEMLAEVQNLEDALTPDDVRLFLESQDITVQLVDLRSPDQFVIGHIDDAVNIPVQDILHQNARRLFADTSKTFILYAGDQVAACAPWMLLKQVGYSNVKVMLGGYDFFKSGAHMPEVMAGKCFDEVAKYDYASFFKGSLPVQNTETALPKIVVQRKKKKSVVSGGC